MRLRTGVYTTHHGYIALRSIIYIYPFTGMTRCLCNPCKYHPQLIDELDTEPAEGVQGGLSEEGLKGAASQGTQGSLEISPRVVALAKRCEGMQGT